MKKWLPTWSNTQSKGNKKVEGSIQESFLLIEGVFLPAEAADVLLSLLNDKIKYHSVQLLNLQDAESDERLNSKKRIAQLKAAKQQVTDIILDSRNDGSRLKIHSTIEITKVRE